MGGRIKEGLRHTKSKTTHRKRKWASLGCACPKTANFFKDQMVIIVICDIFLRKLSPQARFPLHSTVAGLSLLEIGRTSPVSWSITPPGKDTSGG